MEGTIKIVGMKLSDIEFTDRIPISRFNFDVEFTDRMIIEVGENKFVLMNDEGSLSITCTSDLISVVPVRGNVVNLKGEDL